MPQDAPSSQTSGPSRDHHSLLFERNPLPTWVYDYGTLRFLAVNDAAVQTYGYSREEFLAMTIMDIRPAEEVPRLKEMLPKLQSGEVEEHAGLWLHELKDGTHRWMDITALNIEYGDRPARLVCARDVTEQKQAEQELRDAASLMEQAQSVTGMGAWKVIYGQDGVEVVWSDSTYALFGVRPEEFQLNRRNFLGLVHPEDRPRLLAATESWAHRTGAVEQEFRIQRPDGQVRWLREKARVIPATETAPRTLLGVVMDITEEREREEQLRLLHSAADQSGEAIVITDAILEPPGPRIVYANKHFEKLTGYTAEEVIGKSPRILQGPLSSGTTLEGLKETLRRGESFTGSSVNYRKDGSAFPVEWSISPVRTPDGRTTHYVSIQRDVTERLKMEEELLDRRRTFSLVLETALAGYWDWNLVDNTEYLSPKFKHMFGYEDHEMENSLESWQRIIFPEDLREVLKVFDRHVATRGKEPFYNEVRYRHKDGSTVWVICTGEVIEWAEDGSPVRMVGCHVDITGRKQAEEALKESEQKLELFFSQSLDGCFFMMLDEPVVWDESSDKERVLDYVFAHQRMTKVNQALLDQYGAQEQDFIGLTPADLFRHDPEHGRHIWRGLFDHGRLHVETDERRLDGTPVVFDGDYICIYDKEGRITGHFGVQRDVTERKREEERRRLYSEFQEAAIEVSANLLAVTTDEELDRVINATLARLGRVFGVDRSYVFSLSSDLEYMTNTHEWCAEGVASQKGRLRDFPTGTMPWWKQEIIERRLVHIPDVEALPPEAAAEKEEFQSQGIRSLISLPMIGAKGLLTGFVGFDAVREKRSWPDDLTAMLQLLAEIIGNAFERRRAEHELRESEARLKRILQDAETVAVQGYSMDGTVQYWNRACTRLYQYTEQEALGRNMLDLIIPPEMREEVAEGIRRMAETGRPMPASELRLMRKDGTLVSVYSSHSLVQVAGREPEFFCIDVDMADLRQAEEALRESEERLQAFLFHSPLLMMEHGLDGRYQLVNPAAASVFGLAPSEVEGRTFEELLPPEVSSVFKERIARVRETLQPLVVEDALQLEAGERHYLSTLYPLLDEQDRLRSIGSIVQDITERKQAEEALQESEAFVRDVMDSLPVGVAVNSVTPDVSFVYMNDNFPHIYHTTREALTSPDTFWDAVYEDPEFRAEIKARVEADCATGDPGKMQWTDVPITRDGRLVAYISATNTPVPGKNLMISTVRDVTDRKLAQQALLESYRSLEERVKARTRELEVALGDMLAARQEAEKANRAKSEFLSRMSHELRTPLNAVLGFAQVLDMTSTGESEKKSLGHILAAGRHLLNLINEVLDISRIESGRLAIETEVVKWRNTVAQCLDLLHPEISKQKLTVKRDIPDGAPQAVEADPNRLRQVFLNILSNAVKYNKEGGEIRITAEETTPGRLRVIVSDTGRGIEPEGLERIFEPFERLGADMSGIEGIGLGLPLAKKLVTAMGGSISIESTPGEGTSATIELALADSPLVDAHGGRTSSSGIVRMLETEGSAEVLYIEDNPSNVEVVERVLASATSCRFRHAATGEEGLRAALEHPPSLILLDMHLPGMSGARVLGQLRSDPSTATIPIVVVTADAALVAGRAAEELGADAVVTKPIDVGPFLKTIRALLAEHGHSGG